MRTSWKLTVWVVVALLGAPVRAQVTRRVSVSSTGVQGNGASESWLNSADGSLTIITSLSSNLVPMDTNGVGDIFVYDSVNETMERVSVATGGAEANDTSYWTAISPDGRYAVFGSVATNLVVGDTNGFQDVFVRDRLAGTTERVSVDSGGAQADASSTGFAAGNPLSITPGGRYVGFDSLATNLVAGDTNSLNDVFVRDRQLGTTERVSVATGGAQATLASFAASVSADGRYVAFVSLAPNLVAGDFNGALDVFVRDRVSGTTERVSVDSAEVGGNGVSDLPSISSDGRYVVFDSTSTNLVAGDTNGFLDVFVRDRTSGTTFRVSVDSSGAQGNQISLEPSISADGRFVTFRSFGTNLVPGDTNGFGDVFVRDLLAGNTWRVSVDSSGNESNGESSWPWISGDGGHICFMSAATNLVSGDTNFVTDVFVHSTGAGGTQQESDGVGGVPSNGPSLGPSLSPDARFLAFESDATNIVVGDTNGSRDIFLKDREAGTITLVSVDSGGAQANADSFRPAVSADGRYVAFQSDATNLVGGDTNSASDVFVRDLVGNATTRVSVDSGGVQGNGGSSNPAISSDGRYLAFESAASNLVPGDLNLVVDVFLRDRQLGTTVRTSVDSGGTQGLGGGSADPSISFDGRYVAFESTATNLVAGDSNSAMDIFVRDLVGSLTTRWSVDSGGTQGNGDSSNPAISGDGGSVAFQSTATNLVPGDLNLVVDVFVRRGSTGTVRRTSVADDGTQGLGGGSTDPSISVDGRSVGFASDATNLVSGDTNAASDVFVNDAITGGTRRVSVDSDGAEGTGASGGSAISADGRIIAFDSFASDLVLGDTNGFQDVFLRDEGTESAFESFCFGDGTGSPCPCSNTGSPGRGCQNSGGTGGALLTVTGTAQLTADTVQFTSSGEKPTALSIFLQGTTAIAPATYGDGLRCTGGALKRLFVKSAVGGVAVAPQAGDLSVSARSAFMNAPISLGATREYQVYYRDSVLGFCPSPPGSTFNVSNGMIVAWGG